MSKGSSLSHKFALRQPAIAVGTLHLAVAVVNEHVAWRSAFGASSRQFARCEDALHSSKFIIRATSGRVNENDPPFVGGHVAWKGHCQSFTVVEQHLPIA